VKHVFTRSYKPTTNEQVERWNTSLVDAIAQLSMENDWDLALGLACTAYNSTVHSSTGYAPIEFSSTRDPCPNVWTRQPDLLHRTAEHKFRFRHSLLARAAKLCAAAKEKTLSSWDDTRDYMTTTSGVVMITYRLEIRS
jgi:hypothetical protein